MSSGETVASADVDEQHEPAPPLEVSAPCHAQVPPGSERRPRSAVHNTGGMCHAASARALCAVIDVDGTSALGDDDLAAALTAAIHGEEAGLTDLWRALQPPLLRYLRVVTGDAAEDVASEVWLQVACGIEGFDGRPTAFRVWLFRIARHRAIDENRRARRRRDTACVPRVPESAGVSDRDVALDVIERADTEWALRVIASLPPDQAEAVMLRAVAGLDVAQAAQVLGKRPGAVRIASMRGLRRLAAHPDVACRRPLTGRLAQAAAAVERSEAEGV